MNEIHRKVSIWAKLHRQWETMESNLRSKPRAAAEAGNEQCAMEIELRALRAQVDTAFNEASAAIHSRGRKVNEGAPGRERRAERRG